MEALILIPIGLIIFGWMKSIPAGMTPPSGVNGVTGVIAFGNGYCDDFIQNDDSLFANDDDGDDSTLFNGSNIFSCDGGVDSSVFENCALSDMHTMQDDLMFNPAFEWCSINIYHHEDHSFDNSFSDPFSGIDDSISISHSFDD